MQAWHTIVERQNKEQDYAHEKDVQQNSLHRVVPDKAVQTLVVHDAVVHHKEDDEPAAAQHCERTRA